MYIFDMSGDITDRAAILEVKIIILKQKYAYVTMYTV